MGSLSNQNLGGSYDTYKDCSQGVCSLYCPQWCYVLSPPPPYFPGYTQDDDSSIDFSPLIIAIIGILASAFLLICYYTIISKYCMRRGNRDSSLGFNSYHTNAESFEGASTGLDEALIKSITVCKYKKGDGLVEGTDCSVCLSEFQENENLRLLPKCNHAFHLPCIDTWLSSNSSCPLCRSNIATADSLPPQSLNASQEAQPHPNVNRSAHEFQHMNDTVLVIQDVEGCQEGVVSVIEDVHVKTPTQVPRNLDGIQPIRRSISMNSLCPGRISIADILHASEDDQEIQVDNQHVSIGIQTQTSRYHGEEQGKSDDRKGVLHLVRNPSAIKRSISTGRFMFTRYGKGRNHIIPN